jgi:hypothetical protein
LVSPGGALLSSPQSATFFAKRVKRKPSLVQRSTAGTAASPLASRLAANAHPTRTAGAQRHAFDASQHRADRPYSRSDTLHHPGQRDEAWFKREIAPKLDAFTLKEIGKATGLSLAACSRIRAGAKAPHRRHWEALRALVGGREGIERLYGAGS